MATTTKVTNLRIVSSFTDQDIKHNTGFVLVNTGNLLAATSEAYMN